MRREVGGGGRGGGEGGRGGGKGGSRGKKGAATCRRLGMKVSPQLGS